MLHKEDNAHEESIWCVAWGRSKHSADPEGIKSEGSASDSNDSNEKNDFIVTGSLDDTVKVWSINENRLKLRKELSGHSLGVVSVAISNDGQKIASSSLDSGLYIVS